MKFEKQEKFPGQNQKTSRQQFILTSKKSNMSQEIKNQKPFAY